MKPGPPPKPTALKKLEGNAGKRKLNASEPKPKAQLPRCPVQLSPNAKTTWKRLGDKLLKSGLIAELDEAAFAVLCESYAAYLDLLKRARADGPIVNIGGQAVPNPYLSRADREAEKVRKLLGEFGMTPSSRSRIALPPSQDEDQSDKFDL